MGEEKVLQFTKLLFAGRIGMAWRLVGAQLKLKPEVIGGNMSINSIIAAVVAVIIAIVILRLVGVI